MLRDSAKEFIDREVVPQKERFEKKIMHSLKKMRKLGEMGMLGIAVPEEYGGLGMGFVTTMLACDYFPELQVHWQQLMEHIPESEHFLSFFTELKSRKKISSGFSNRNKIRSLLFD
jgi:alkylation response protein AidB-like acyl-CoA dehydrogenase